MNILLLRHATLLLGINEKKILVDPMLSSAESMPPIQNSTNSKRNPLVPLAVSEPELQNIDAILITHTHRDHFDDTAAQILPKDVPVFCQPEDEEKIKSSGFLQVFPVSDTYIWEEIKLIRTGGRHGTGTIGQKMGPVSGFVLQTEGEPSLYIAGDTIYCPEIETALEVYQPQIAVVNAGAAQFAMGDPITMTAEDVVKLCRKAPAAQVIAVHMEAINHCLLTRNGLRDYLEKAGLLHKVQIPADGEMMQFGTLT